MRVFFLGLVLWGAVAAPAAERFVFAVLGCQPYARFPDSAENFARLIAEINRANPAFTVHLGDFKGSEEPATDEFYRRRRADFNTFTGPLIYTPGDNEWTDTHYESAGRRDPLERLSRLRELFFAEARATAAPGVVLLFQADPLAADFGQPGVAKGFARFLRVIADEAQAWAKPVLLVHADEHRYRLEVGVQLLPDEPPLPNVTRLETFGEWNVHGALVCVDPGSPQLFLCGPLIVPGNPPPRLTRPQKEP